MYLSVFEQQFTFLTNNRGILPVVTRVSLNSIVRTLPHTLLTASTVQIIDVDGPHTLSVTALSTNGPYKEMKLAVLHGQSNVAWLAIRYSPLYID